MHEAGGAPTSELVRAVAEAIDAHDKDQVRNLLADVHGRDLADLIELLGAEERIALIQAMGADFDFEVLTEVDEKVRDQISEALPNDVLAKAVTDLDSDDAAYIIGGLEAHANSVRLRQHRQGAHQILSIGDSHGPEDSRMADGPPAD